MEGGGATRLEKWVFLDVKKSNMGYITHMRIYEKMENKSNFGKSYIAVHLSPSHTVSVLRMYV